MQPVVHRRFFADIKALISWNRFIDSYWSMYKNAFIFLHIVMYYIQYCISIYGTYIFLYCILSCDIIDLEWNKTTAWWNKRKYN